MKNPKIPKFNSVRMVEWATGFGLLPYYRASMRCRIELNRVKIRQKGIIARFFGLGVECWAVQVWESQGSRFAANPTWQSIMDPETTEKEAKREYDKIGESYENPDKWEEVAQLLRSPTPQASLPPSKPEIEPGKTTTRELQACQRHYEQARELRLARFQVLKSVMPQTAALVEKSEETGDTDEKNRLLLDAVTAFFAERGQYFSEEVFQVWQQTNPIPQRLFALVAKWQVRLTGKELKPDPIDYELALNWNSNPPGIDKPYNRMTAKELSEALFKVTGVRLSDDLVKKRRERLGLTTERPPGPQSRV
jgi:hypothetical protein